MDARAAVEAAAALVRLAHENGEPPILDGAPRGRTAHPGVVARAGDSQHATEHRDRVVGSLGVDDRLSSPPLFFGMSCSTIRSSGSLSGSATVRGEAVVASVPL